MLRFSLLRAPGTERFFRTKFCVKSAFAGATIIRNNTRGIPETLLEPPEYSFDQFLPGKGKRGHERRTAIILLVAARAHPRDSGTLRTFAVTVRIFVARSLSG